MWNDLTIDWNDVTCNDLTMERNDQIPFSLLGMRTFRPQSRRFAHTTYEGKRSIEIYSVYKSSQQNPLVIPVWQTFIWFLSTEKWGNC